MELVTKKVRLGRVHTTVVEETPSTLDAKKSKRALALSSIKVETIDKDGNKIILDGDVIYPKGDRPASAVLIKNQHDLMNESDTTIWIDANNNPKEVSKNSLGLALKNISLEVNKIWGIA
jgi:trans-2-enoyl-CoA reductase